MHVCYVLINKSITHSINQSIIISNISIRIIIVVIIII